MSLGGGRDLVSPILFALLTFEAAGSEDLKDVGKDVARLANALFLYTQVTTINKERSIA